MAKASPNKAAKEDSSEENASVNPSEILGKFLKQNKEEHYNFVKDVNYEVSSGSLNFDSKVGLFKPGLVRCAGPSSAGKTSFSMGVAKNFLETVPKSRVIYIKSEGRLSSEIQNRTGIKFTKNYEDFTDGMAFVFECNIYEVVISMMRELIVNNPSGTIYMFIIDSMDGLNLRGDYIKTVSEQNKVAGAPLMTKQFLQKMSIAMTKYGHLAFFLSQISSEIKLDPYAKVQPRQVAGGGGNAVQHFSNIVLNFQDWNEYGDLLLEDPTEKKSATNRILGHKCKIKMSKADKEVRHEDIEIPIRHNQTNGKSIWREREIFDQLFIYQLIQKNGAWLNISSTIREAVASGLNIKIDDPINLPEKINGATKLQEFLDNNPKLIDFLFSHFKGLAALGKAA